MQQQHQQREQQKMGKLFNLYLNFFKVLKKGRYLLLVRLAASNAK